MNAPSDAAHDTNVAAGCRLPGNNVQQQSMAVTLCNFALLQVNSEKITTGSVRRAVNCLCFSADGAWLFAGTASGDVLTVNVGRKAVQVGHLALD